MFGWSECGGCGVDGVCGMAVCEGDDVERDSDCNGGGCGGSGGEISSEFGVVGFGRRVSGDGDAVVAFGIAGGVARMCRAIFAKFNGAKSPSPTQTPIATQ